MYSPRISEKHIPVLYRLAKVQQVPMTRLVNQIIGEYLDGRNNNLYALTSEGIAESAAIFAKSKLERDKLKKWQLKYHPEKSIQQENSHEMPQL